MAAKEQNQHIPILADIRKKNFKPVYFLMGDESYYIDLIHEEIINYALEDSERDFNQTILYGADIDDISLVINAAKRYPMMAPRQLVVVKEAQNIKNLDDLVFYVQRPLTSTVLVICYKNAFYKGKKLIAEITKNGIFFESKKIYDNQLPSFISNYVVSKKMTIDPKAVSMLADFVGTDLSRMTGELDKLIISLANEQTRITPEMVECNVGVSKDFNNFELLDAIISRNIFKANQIINYFERNPKNNPMIVTVSVLFNFFSNLMLTYFSIDKSDNGLMRELGLKSVFQVRNYVTAMRNYNAFKCIDIIAYIREYDARSKGIGTTSSTNDAALLKELIYKILH